MRNQTLLFLKEGIAKSKQTGSLCATSKFSAVELCHPLLLPRKPLNILEVGAGTGAVTEEILRNLIEGDSLKICELNPTFMSVLQSKLDKNENYLRYKKAVSLFSGAVQTLPEDVQYNVIISALPFLNFESETTKSILQKYKKVAAKDSIMTYYEYIGLRSVGKEYATKEHKERLAAFDKLFKESIKPAIIKRKRVWRNVPPINIYTVRVEELRV